jgi:chemotaxis response regulator CheB
MEKKNIIVIGASAGGFEAIKQLLQRFRLILMPLFL